MPARIKVVSRCEFIVGTGIKTGIGDRIIQQLFLDEGPLPALTLRVMAAAICLLRCPRHGEGSGIHGISHGLHKVRGHTWPL